jgi:hypothetical protein
MGMRFEAVKPLVVREVGDPDSSGVEQMRGELIGKWRQLQV